MGYLKKNGTDPKEIFNFSKNGSLDAHEQLEQDFGESDSEEEVQESTEKRMCFKLN